MERRESVKSEELRVERLRELVNKVGGDKDPRRAFIQKDLGRVSKVGVRPR